MIKIHKEVYGQGQPIVLIHGWAMHTGIWRVFAKQLALHYQVICLDLPGHGLSESVNPYTLGQLSDALIESFPEQPCCVLGWSLGATVALAIADKFPARVESLVLLAGNPRFVAEPEWAGMKLKLLQAFAENLLINCPLTLLRFLALQVNSLPNAKPLLKELKLAINACEPPSTAVLQSALDILQETDLRQSLSNLNIPVSLIHGDKDSLIPVQVSEDIKKIQPLSEINVIAGAGHVPFLSHQIEVINIIKKFL